MIYKISTKLDVTLYKKYQGKNEPLACVNRSVGKKKAVNSVFSFSMQLYSLKQIINVLLQAENILEKILRNHVTLTQRKTNIMRTGDIVKQNYFVKNLHGENLKLFKRLHANIFYEIISKFQIYFSETCFPYLSFYV